MIKTLNDTRTIANPAVSCCFSLAHGWHDTHVVHVSSGNVVHIAMLVKYTLVSQITRVTRRFYLQTSGPRFHYACILRIVSDDE